MPKRAVGIVRVSKTAGREGETFHSPVTQRDRIVAECNRQNFELIEVHDELDVSGGKPLEQRTGLLSAVEAIEGGKAEVVVAAYLDRLTRSVRVRGEVIERVEAAGGMVLTVDMGVQTDATAGQWLTGTMSSAVAEYLRRTTAERSAVAQQRSIDRGIQPYPSVALGYIRPEVGRQSNGRVLHGPLVIDQETAPLVVRAYEMRAGGASIDAVRAMLRDAGVEITFRRTQIMLGSKIYLGQIHFGGYTPNLEAHPPLIDVDLWEQVQKVKVPRGPRPKSMRLLARLGILRCGNCGGALAVGHVRAGEYPFYRCSPTGDCDKRVTMSATIAETVAIEAVKQALAGIEGRASAADNAREIEVAFSRAQAEFDDAVRAFSSFEAEPAVVDRLRELRAARDEARAQLDQLSGLHSAVVLTIDDWDRFDLDIQRDLIAATIERIDVGPGRGAERLTVHLFGD